MKAVHLSHSFGKETVFDDLSVDFGDKGLIALLGKSGSGKSTLLSILAGNLKPNVGEVIYQDKTLTSLKRKELTSIRLNDFSFLYQNHNLLDEESVFTNCALPLRMLGYSENDIQNFVDSYLKQFGLIEVKEKCVSILSGGEKARVSLIRALVKKPKVIFADEPTGSLDKENAKLVMEELKRVSKEALVLFVTHNVDFANEYADGIYYLEEKRADFSPIFQKEQREERKENRSWIFSLLHGKRMRNSTFWATMLASSVAYLSLILTISFQTSSTNILEEESKNILLSSMATISREVSVSLSESPLSLIQSERPAKKEVSRYVGEEIAVYPNLSYFFPVNTAFKVNGYPIQGANFYPVFNMSLQDGYLSLVKQGEAPKGETFDYLIINEEFAEILPVEPFEARIDVTVKVSIKEQEIYEDIVFAHRFQVAAIIKEFSFLSTPRAYYSYDAFFHYLENVSLPHLSAQKQMDLNVISYLNELPSDSPYHSYSWYLYAAEEKSRDRLRELSYQDGSLVISSQSEEIANGFSQLTTSFSSLCMPFLGIEIGATIFIVATLLLAAFLRKRKEAAILYGEGACEFSLFFLYASSGIFASLLAGMISLITALPFSYLLSFFLEKEVGIASLMSVPFTSFLGIPYLLPLLVFLLSLFLPVIGAYFPLSIALRRNLTEELREE